jgi:hypothetical protein
VFGSLVDALYITLDDSAAYGLNMDEAAELSAQVEDAGLGQSVLLYQVGPG